MEKNDRHSGSKKEQNSTMATAISTHIAVNQLFRPYFKYLKEEIESSK